MPIVVQCECGKKSKAPDEAAGKSVRCPACKGRIVVPAIEALAVQAGDQPVGGASCPSCEAPLLQPGAVICIHCGYDLRSGRRAGASEPAASAAAKPAGRYPHTGLALVYWGTRFGFSLTTATMGFGLLFAGFWLAGQPGFETSDMAWLMILGVIFAAAGIQVGAKGARVDWFSHDDDDLDFEELLLARGAPTVAGLVAAFVWVTGRLDILFNLLLPLGLIGSTTAMAIGLTFCLVMSSGGVQRLLAVGSALGYLGGAALVILIPFYAVMGGVGVLLAAMGEVCFLLWLRELGRLMDFEAVVVHVIRLLIFVAVGGVVVAILAVLLSGSLQAALKFPPVFSIGAFCFYICGLLYVTTATIWRLKIMRALLDEIEAAPPEASL